MRAPLRKLLLTAHVSLSVGWLGAVLPYLALALIGLLNDDDQRARSAYLAMETMGQLVIVPLSLAALASGVLQSSITPWGLFRHYWVSVKLLLTVIATAILLRHMPSVTRMADIARDVTLSLDDVRPLRTQLVVHASGGLLVLLVVTALSVFKPGGMTPYGRRKQEEQREAVQRARQAVARGETETTPATSDPEPAPGSRTGRLLLALVGVVVLIAVLMHLARGGPLRH